MRRSDRRTPNDDNARNHPTSRRQESRSLHEYKQLYLLELNKSREARDAQAVLEESLHAKEILIEDWKQKADQHYQAFYTAQLQATTIRDSYEQLETKNQEILIQNQALDAQLVEYKTLFPAVQAERDAVQAELENVHFRVLGLEGQLNESSRLAQSWHNKYQVTSQSLKGQQQSLLEIQAQYDQKSKKCDDLEIKVHELDAQRVKYLNLYNEAQISLTQARRSKAGIKGWETRRKKENAKLKQEISDMVILLRESLEREGEATTNLYDLANRMDKIQGLVDSVEDETSLQPLNLLQKFRRIWIAIREILSE